ncbi:aminomethyl-transferring glycine dehydrogenase subunit GcvPB [Clostridium sporogenes]|uniref:aminomethyl-transferring glycine dehydrogenase subunit GcvPB n=1 Tax=Clostridium sporogenes TaxID=1509 RepID=UPI00024B9F43|nr:aminomethyl-transferring glycine dehydrogenase subunit GcvPB [Clostridium sporogenes]EHN15260.1 glycine dehydrogenase subunit 2 [Clostridium sporogenes PA 3679]MCW6105567.1 aminomethyl-transferring glycine dehydrogenase subunit GcvPB [Clostridium sporogenes]MDU4596529.1 aminomethyl-transferring glycine dehydrogenase subunit GcvPB [Clostridium sporogenes]NFF66229.1 glycine dehydrogenase subunit 2 [Clostridium sporogenes]NFF97214.1 glycine dehydrogenase subunit 2 [Clostridium sporogenes]
MKDYNKVIFELSSEGRKGYRLPDWDVPEVELSKLLPKNLLREDEIDLPEVSEVDVVRHYTALSNKNYTVDNGFYPLGSCTMKYNPKINEDMAALNGFSKIHPLQDENISQGALELMYDLKTRLCEITGLDDFTLQPAAGAHGEYTGLLIIKAYHEKRGDTKRTKIIVPDSAHGTNPASASVAGFDIVEIKSGEDGRVSIEELKKVLNDEIAGLMLTNPSTLGLFEKDIKLISELVHEAGGLLYYDGANLNAIMGIARPGDMGFDVCHLNMHKTFSTPHGGGGPGSGPVGVKKHLAKFLPIPTIEKENDKFILDYNREDSLGKIRSLYGNFGVMVKAYAYILTMGKEGLKAASHNAVLNANYIKESLRDYYNIGKDDICKHEVILSTLKENPHHITTLDIAKRLIDYGVHPPTVYFPLIIEEALMIEPTESESKETVDEFIDAMKKIAVEAKENPELLHEAPVNAPVRRLDQVKAARKPILKWQK